MAGESSEAEDMPASTNPASSSPCFDISEFLGTPRKDGGNTDEVFSNLSGLNLSPSSFNMLAPLPVTCKSESVDHVHDTDFSTLLLYHQKAGAGSGGGEGHAQVLQGSQSGNSNNFTNRELIGFDELDAQLAKDAFTLFGCSSDDNLVNNSVSPFPPGEARLSSINFPPANMFGQHGSFLAGESGGIGEDLHGSLAMGEAVVAPNLSFAGNACEWGVLCEGPAHHVHHSNTVQQHNALQCDSCQILRCIIHSNGA